MVRADGMLHNLHKALLILSNKKTGTKAPVLFSKPFNIIVINCPRYW